MPFGRMLEKIVTIVVIPFLGYSLAKKVVYEKFGYVRSTEFKQPDIYVHHRKIKLFVFWKVVDYYTKENNAASGTFKLYNGKKVKVYLQQDQFNLLKNYNIELECLGEKFNKSVQPTANASAE